MISVTGVSVGEAVGACVGLGPCVALAFAAGVVVLAAIGWQADSSRGSVTRKKTSERLLKLTLSTEAGAVQEPPYWYYLNQNPWAVAGYGDVRTCAGSRLP